MEIMTPSKKIESLITSNYYEYRRIVKKLTKKPDAEDVLHECLKEVLELKEDRKEKIIGYFKYYLISMFKNSCYSKTSSYYRKYRRLEHIVISSGDLPYELLDIPDPQYTEDANLKKYDYAFNLLTKAEQKLINERLNTTFENMANDRGRSIYYMFTQYNKAINNLKLKIYDKEQRN